MNSNQIKMTSKTTSNENEVVEERWELPSDFSLFAKPMKRKVFYPTRDGTPSTHSFAIECIEPDSPLDIINFEMSTNEYDATGHCVWSGAFLLVNCMRELLNRYSLGNKRMIELGSGTGIGGLAVMLTDVDKEHRPSHVCFTDNDPAVLELCQRNCDLNHLSKESYTIQELTWGEETDDEIELFDIALATDVLYDVDLIEPLFTTVARTIPLEGIFILSHIPRACYNEGNPPEAIKDLEKYIVDQASIHGFCLHHIIRPPSEDELSPEILEWCSRGALRQGAILVFRRNQ